MICVEYRCWYFCPENQHTTNANSSTGKNGGTYTRVWWMMPNGEWAAFRELYYKSNIQYFHAHFMLKKSNGRLEHNLYTFSRFSQQIIVV